jgi:anti-sigma factor RsiW
MATPETRPEPPCREILALLADYLDGTLAVATARRLDAHLAGCAPCVAFVNTYRGTVAAARRLATIPIPPELQERLLSFLRARPAPPRPRRPRGGAGGAGR